MMAKGVAVKRPAVHATLGRAGVVGTRLDEDEMRALDQARGRMSRSAFLRMAVLRAIKGGQVTDE